LNKLTKLKELSKKLYYKEQFSENINKIVFNNQDIDNSLSIAVTFNEHFASIGTI